MVRFIYTTISTHDAALSLTTQIIENKLAACANIISGMTSVYPWDGKLETASECVVIIKTTKEKVEACKSFIKTIHPYEVPCIAEIDVASINDGYRAWITKIVHS